jgi:hypothetical protein
MFQQPNACAFAQAFLFDRWQRWPYDLAQFGGAVARQTLLFTEEGL